MNGSQTRINGGDKVKGLKRILSVLMIVSILVSGVIYVSGTGFDVTSATGDDRWGRRSTSTDAPKATSTDTNAPTDSRYVARMYICYTYGDRKWPETKGHTWIYIENLSDHEIQVGAYLLPVGQGVSLGTFAKTVNDGRGVYYNVEAYCMRDSAQRISLYLSKDLDEATMARVSDKINNSNFWTYLTNCVFFACTTWNRGGGAFQFPFGVPMINIIFFRLYRPKTGISMYKVNRNQVLKHAGAGSDSWTQAVSDQTLSTKVG